MTRRSLRPGLLLGIGLGGFVDGIVLHQILQWHHMLTSEGCCPDTTVAGLRDNTLADGLFHAATWVVTMAGSVAAVRAWRAGELGPSWRAHAGALLVGWGLFNLVEGLVGHVLLAVHHVRDDLGGPASWDIGFLVLALVQIGVGLTLARPASRPPSTSPPHARRAAARAPGPPAR